MVDIFINNELYESVDTIDISYFQTLGRKIILDILDCSQNTDEVIKYALEVIAIDPRNCQHRDDIFIKYLSNRHWYNRENALLILDNLGLTSDIKDRLASMFLRESHYKVKARLRVALRNLKIINETQQVKDWLEQFIVIEKGKAIYKQ